MDERVRRQLVRLRELQRDGKLTSQQQLQLYRLIATDPEHAEYLEYVDRMNQQVAQQVGSYLDSQNLQSTVHDHIRERLRNRVRSQTLWDTLLRLLFREFVPITVLVVVTLVLITTWSQLYSYIQLIHTAFVSNEAVVTEITQPGTVDSNPVTLIHLLEWEENGEVGWDDQLLFSPDGRILVGLNTNGLVTLWDVQTGTVLYTLDGEHFRIYDAMFSPDGQQLYVLQEAGTIIQWDVTRGEQIASIRLTHDDIDTSTIGTFFVYPEEQTVATINAVGLIAFWSLEDARLIRVYETISNVDRISVAKEFSPDGQLLAIAEHGGTIALWRVRDGVRAYEFTDLSSTAADIEFNSDGTVIGATAFDTDMQVWEVPSGEIVQSWRRIYETTIAFSPDGQLLVTGRPTGDLLFWHIQEGIQIHTISMGNEMQSGINSVAWSPDGQFVAAKLYLRTSEDFPAGALRTNTIALWRINFP